MMMMMMMMIECHQTAAKIK